MPVLREDSIVSTPLLAARNESQLCLNSVMKLNPRFSDFVCIFEPQFMFFKVEPRFSDSVNFKPCIRFVKSSNFVVEDLVTDLNPFLHIDGIQKGIEGFMIATNVHK